MHPSEMKDTLLQHRCTDGLNWVVEGDVISLVLRKPSKANVKGDQSINVSEGRMSAAPANSAFTCRRRAMVTGRRRRDDTPALHLMQRR